MKAEILQLFNRIYGKKAEKVFFSPGRVNIIGGHTDYNGGAVLPFCINMGIYGAVTYRNDYVFRVYSENFPDQGIITFDINSLEYDESRSFANYVAGVILKLIENGYIINKGFDLAIKGNLPNGGGLSSSAALSVLIATIINDICHLQIDGKQIAIICRQVENEYIGVSCGIMDQFIIANGVANHAMYLESDTLYYEHIQCVMDEYKFVLINSNVTRKLTESKYNERQRESQSVLKILQKHININHICDLVPEDYDKYSTYIESNDLKDRFNHLINEHHRVKQSRDALRNRDFETLGTLLTAAHHSARDLYKVSSPVLDNLVEMAISSGSVGSKMIGGGFGGSILNLVKTDELNAFISKFREEYINIYEKEPIINVVEMMDGVKEI